MEAFYLLTSALFYPSTRRCFQRRRGLEGWVRVSQQQSNLERRKCLVTCWCFRIKVSGQPAVRERAKRLGRCWTTHTKKGTAASGTHNAALWDTRRSWNYSSCMENFAWRDGQMHCCSSLRGCYRKRNIDNVTLDNCCPNSQDSKTLGKEGFRSSLTSCTWLDVHMHLCLWALDWTSHHGYTSYPSLCRNPVLFVCWK